MSEIRFIHFLHLHLVFWLLVCNRFQQIPGNAVCTVLGFNAHSPTHNVHNLGNQGTCCNLYRSPWFRQERFPALPAPRLGRGEKADSHFFFGTQFSYLIE